MSITRKHSVIHKFIVACILLLLVDLLFFNQLVPLRAEEPRRAVVAYEMLSTRNFIVPHIHGEHYFNKPPVFNWLIALSMSIFGVNEWAARLPGVLSFIGIALLVFFSLKKYASQRVQWLAPFAFLTSADLLFYGSINAAEIDLFYSLITALQVIAIFKFRQEENYLQLFLYSYLLMAIGVLTKGIPSIAFQAITLISYLLFSKRFIKLFSWQHLLGFLVGTGLVSLYLSFFSLESDLPTFLSQQFKEASQRTANEAGLLQIIQQIVNLPLLFLEKIFPWSLFVFLFLNKSIREAVWKNEFYRFSLIFLLSNCIIYWTAPDLRVRYVYMFFPFIIILLLSTIDAIQWQKERVVKMIKPLLNLALVGAGLAFIVIPIYIKLSSFPLFVVSILVAALLMFLGWQFHKTDFSYTSLWFLVMGLLICRLGFNLIALPEIAKKDIGHYYKSSVLKMIDLANGRPIYLGGPHELLIPNISFFGKTIYKHRKEIPPTIPYQIPYYYAQFNQRTMYYEEFPTDTSNVYLAYKDLVNSLEDKKVLFEIMPSNTQKPLILYEITRN